MDSTARLTRGCVLCSLVLFFVMLSAGWMAMPAVAWAEEGVFGEQDGEVDNDTAGNVVMAGNSVSVTHDVQRDAMLAGREVKVADVSVAGDVLAAGQTVRVADSRIAGNVRAAGDALVVESVDVAGNVTACGNSVEIGGDSKAASIYAFGSYLAYEGTAQYVALSGQQVQFDGEVDGDVHIDASSVAIGENARVTGTLTVEGAQPDVAPGAQVESMNVQAADEGSVAQSFLASLVNAIVLLFTLIATIAVIWWIAPGAAQDSLFMFRARTAPMIVTGVVALLAMPFAIAVLLASGIGMLLAIVLICLVVVMAVLGMPFMCAAISRRIMRGSREWVVVAMAAAIAGFMLSVPIANMLGMLCGCVYFAGYVLQLLFLKISARSAMRSSKASAGNEQAGER